MGDVLKFDVDLTVCQSAYLLGSGDLFNILRNIGSIDSTDKLLLAGTIIRVLFNRHHHTDPGYYVLEMKAAGFNAGCHYELFIERLGETPEGYEEY